MCQWGESEDVEVTIVASLSSTGLAKRKVVGIDRCIAPLVRALDAAGILMTASCCGHGKASGRIDLEDGRVLTVNGPTFEPQVAHGTPAPRIDTGPHPDCPRCKGTGEEPNAQFRCPCRWRKQELLDEINRQHGEELDAIFAHGTPAARPAEDKRALIETIQRERDRAQAIIHAASRGVPLSWGMFLKAGHPDVDAIAAEANQTEHSPAPHATKE